MIKLQNFKKNINTKDSGGWVLRQFLKVQTSWSARKGASFSYHNLSLELQTLYQTKDQSWPFQLLECLWREGIFDHKQTASARLFHFVTQTHWKIAIKVLKMPKRCKSVSLIADLALKCFPHLRRFHNLRLLLVIRLSGALHSVLRRNSGGSCRESVSLHYLIALSNSRELLSAPAN